MDSPKTLSVMSVIFPVEDDTDIMGIMKKVKEALSDLPTLKLDTRIIMVKEDAVELGRQSDLSTGNVDSG